MRLRYVCFLCLAVLCTGLFFGGCKKKETGPSNPPTATFTPVPPVNTATAITTPHTPTTIGTSTATAISTPTTTSTTPPTQTASATGTSTSTSTGACTVLMCSFESLTENGTMASAGAYDNVSVTTSHATLGTNALQIALVTGGPNNLTSWTSFAPKTWTNVTQVVMDLYVDPTLITGTYHQLRLAESSSIDNYWAFITGNTPIVAGAQSVTFTVDWSQGSLTASSVMTNLILAWNTDSTGTGSFYIDNVRLVGTGSACPPAPPTPPSTCGLMDSFETNTENGSVASATMAKCAVGYSNSNATVGNQSLQANVTVGGGCNLTTWTGFAPNKWPDVTQVIMDVYVDPSLVTGTYHQLRIVESSAADNYWSPMTVNVDVVAGAQSVTFNVDWTQGSLTAASTLSNLIFVWNTDSTTTGSFYFDNIRLKNGAGCNP